MNEFFGKGNLTRDAEVKQTSTGKHYTKFTIAINRFVKEGDAWKKLETTFLPCQAWGSLAVKVSTLKKGDAVSIKGRIEINKDANNKIWVKCVLNRVDKLERAAKAVSAFDKFPTYATANTYQQQPSPAPTYGSSHTAHETMPF